MISFKQKRWFL